MSILITFLTTSMTEVVLLLLLWFIAYGLGKTLLRILALDLPVGERWCLATSLGWGMLGPITLLLGGCGLLYRCKI